MIVFSSFKVNLRDKISKEGILVYREFFKQKNVLKSLLFRHFEQKVLKISFNFDQI